MNLFGLLGVARDGMLAQSAALAVTGQNVTNALTPGYVRRTALLETTSSGSVSYTQTERAFDRLAYGHVLDQQSKYSAASARGAVLSELEVAIAPPSGSIGDRAIAFVRSLAALAGSPTDTSLRTDALGMAANLATTVSTTAESLAALSDRLVGQANDVVVDLNTQLSRIADLNKQIMTTSASGGDAGALRDQRDLVIREVGVRVGARTVEDETGAVTLFAAGAVLVDREHAATVSMDLDTNGALRFYVTSATKTDITARVDAGVLGGLREARDVDLAKSIADLDAYAYDVANAYNAVHASGAGLDGATGRPLFTPPTSIAGAAAAMSVDPSVAGQPDRIAAATPGDLPGGNTVALDLSGLANRPAFGGSTLADRFAAMAMDVGFRRAAADSEADLRTDALAVAESLEASANGVSIDEEMVNLSRYQRAFEAASRVFRVADELLAGLMESI